MDWKNNFYFQHLLERICQKKSTAFLDLNELMQFTSLLNKEKKSYSIWKPYEEAEYAMVYVDQPLETCVLEITPSCFFQHSDVMGSLYHLQIDKNTFGDIIVGDHCYVVVLESMSEYIIQHFRSIKKQKIHIEKRDLSILNDYHPQYETYSIIVPSLRIDAVLAHILPFSRKEVVNKIHQKEVFINEVVVKDCHIVLKENDRFSVRKYGKYRFQYVEKNTKKDHLVICYQKYK